MEAGRTGRMDTVRVCRPRKIKALTETVITGTWKRRQDQLGFGKGLHAVRRAGEMLKRTPRFLASVTSSIPSTDIENMGDGTGFEEKITDSVLYV